MRSRTAFLVLLIAFLASNALAQSQGTKPASQAAGSSVAATEDEVNQLRSEVAAQRKTIDELKVLVEKLVAGKLEPPLAIQFRFGPWQSLLRPARTRSRSLLKAPPD